MGNKGRRQCCLFVFCIFMIDHHRTYAATAEQGPLNDATVHPTRLDLYGQFMSHNLHFTRRDELSRRKRDIDPGKSFERNPLRVLYSIPFGDRTLTIDLTENEDLATDDFLVERMGESTGEPAASTFSRGTSWPCHFRGHVTGEPGSSVALSTCYGLTGLISTASGDYFLEPLEPPGLGEEEGRPQPHRIYKRDVSAIAGKAEPMMRFTRRKSKSAIGPSQAQKSEQASVLDEESKEFCGVLDTKRGYRHIIRNRERWEQKHRAGAGRSASESPRRRSKRSVSVERMIEMLVVADKTMVDFYESNGHGGIEKYVLTIVNMVSEIFKDASIGNSLHISLVRLILLEDEKKGPKISSHAENTLDGFCKWAKKMNPKGDDHPNHHDVAVLLTRREICSQMNKSCETLGLAHVAGMCQSHRSCSLNQDIGLSVAYTIAHELGHNFAMHHDGQNNDCKPSTKYNHVMAAHLTSSKRPMKWSSCSRKYITRFLDRNWGFCLNDKPAKNPDFSFSKTLPGVLYDADHQCRLMFGEESRHCHGIEDICNRLWCHNEGTCRTRLHAAMAGTKCGRNRWCLDGKCVSMRRQPKTVNGEWGSWSEWTACSRTCGIGVRSSVRHCDDPTPQNGGSYCVGERKRYKTCSKWRCPVDDDARAFRADQCSSFNDVLYRNKTYEWLPVESTLYPCELHCFTRSGKLYFADRLRGKVIDGTKCFPGSDDICVDGICRRLGCDRNIGSRALEDRCGVCHGNGSHCYEVKTTFAQKKGEEYTAAGVIPVGARNIEIEEVKAVSNFLALRHPTNKTHYYLNGNYMIQWDTMFQLAGTQFSYRRENETRDIISAPGPMTEAVMLMVLFVEENPGVSVEYTMPHDIHFDPSPRPELPEFSWKVRGWSECSTACGGGHQILDVVCVERITGSVEDFFCNDMERPAGKRRSCGESLCPARWRTSPWDQCTVTCGKKKGMQARTVACVRSVGENGRIVLNATECAGTERPHDRKKCHAASRLPCPVWKTTDWIECSKTCGGGVSNRTVECVTYIDDDVIDLGDVGGALDTEDVDISVISSDLVPDPRAPTERAVDALQKAKGRNELPVKGLMASVEVEPIDFEPYLDGYEVEDEELCDLTSKPKSRRHCNVDQCPITTSPATKATEAIDEQTTVASGDESFATEHVQSEHTTNVYSDLDFNSEDSQKPTFAPSANLSVNATLQEFPIPAGLLSDYDDAANPFFTTNQTNSENSHVTKSLVSNPRDVISNRDAVTTSVPRTIENKTTTLEGKRAVQQPEPGTSNQMSAAEPDSAAGEKPTLNDSVADDVTSRPTVGEIEYPDAGTPVTSGVSFVREINEAESEGTFVSGEAAPTKQDAKELVEGTGSRDPTPNASASREPSEQGTFESSMVPEVKKALSLHRDVPELLDIGIGDLGAPANDQTGRFIPLQTSRDVDEDEFDVGDPVGDDDAIDFEPVPTVEIIKPDLRNVDLDFDVTIVANERSTEEVTTTSAPPRVAVTSSLTEFGGPSNSETSKTAATLATAMPPVTGQWIVGDWSKCSVTCGVGAKIRQVKCSSEDDDKSCNQADRPAPAILCNLRPCAKWSYGEWTKCTTLCGTGTRVKTTHCTEERTGKPLRPHHCRNLATLPTVKISCRQSKCLKWKTSRWSSCSERCGPGTQRRRVVCPRLDQCDASLMPHDRRSCFEKTCVKWKALDWNKCSVHCGGGIRRREIVCVEKETGVRTNTSLCEPDAHPTRVERCNQGQCPVTDYDFSNCHADRLSRHFCNLLQQLGRCVQPSLAIQCCVTCKTYLSVRHQDKMS